MALLILLKKKILSPAYNNNAGLETENYAYNIRGCFPGVNRDYVKDGNSTNYFGYDLGYEKNGILGNYAPQYNGNISGTIWKSKGDQQNRKYDFAYDAVNRLMKADFTQQNSSAWDISVGINFSMKMGNGTDPISAYDANGNILGMYQMGLKGNSSVSVDDLFYKYLPNSNKLKYVTDAVNSVGSKLGDFQETVQNNTDNKASDKADYTYDANGNLSYDDNKAISSITYNYLNLPSLITITGKGSISYSYDAGGNKLRKTTIENKSIFNKNIETTTITDYIGGLVYESKSDNDPTTVDYANRLQFGGHEEGRIRAVYANAKTPDLPTNFVYDYFLKDHLGNVRMVLTEEQQQDIYPAATLETNLVTTESNYYNIDPTKIVTNSEATGIPAYVNNNGIATNNPGCTGTVCTTDNSQKVYRMNGNENKTGLGITLKVMAGDKVDIFGKSYYFQNNAGGSAANVAVPLLDLLTGFLGGSMGSAVTGAHGAVTAAQINTPAGVTGINSMLTNQTSQSNTAPVVPKAFINYIFFDEQFKAVGSGFSQVNPTGSLKDHHNDAALQNINVPKNGFVYIYCSNESPVNVFFDNLQVVMTRGAIMEETHYYPFGLTMAGISSKAAGKLENKYKYNDKELQSQEFTCGSGLELYDYGARLYDAQIGRFGQIDPHVEKYEGISPYVYCFNNPLRFVDLKGKDPGDIVILYTGANYGQGMTKTTRDIGNNIAGALNGGVGTIYSSSLYRFDDANTQEAYEQIVSNHINNPNGKVLLYG